MAKYGIPYKGSKSQIADSIIKFLPKCIYTNKHGIDLVKPLFKVEQLEMI